MFKRSHTYIGCCKRCSNDADYISFTGLALCAQCGDDEDDAVERAQQRQTAREEID